jgi:2-succinyl-5-enolpyruvyl-6-hydroxy-3-cyclohexene-1-carboxylate synthase
VTLLLTGDMSAQYDIGALALGEITPRFKMAVLNNSGGGIFRFIKTTSHLDELEECFAAKVNLPLRQLAEAYGIFRSRRQGTVERGVQPFRRRDPSAGHNQHHHPARCQRRYP